MLRFIAVALLAFSAGIEGQTKDPEKGAMLLSEARRALGGEDRLRAIKTLDVRGDFKRLAGQTTIEGELQIRLELPDKLRRDEDLSPPGGGPAIVRTEVLNGSTVWDENSGGGGMFVGRIGGGGFGRGGAGRGDVQPGAGRGFDPAQLEEIQRRARQTDLARFALMWLLAVDGPAAWLGTAEAPDGTADVIEVTPQQGPPVRLFLEATSHVPLMLTWQGQAPQMFVAGRRGGRGDNAAPGVDPPPGRGRGPGGAPATLRVSLDDYKTVGGIRLPHLITRGANDMTLEEWAIDGYRLNPSFRDDVFTK